MDPQWYIVIVAWTLILAVLVWLTIRECRNPPEQKQANREKARTRRTAQQQHKTADTKPYYGCLYTLVSNALSFLLLLGGFALTLLVLILID